MVWRLSKAKECERDSERNNRYANTCKSSSIGKLNRWKSSLTAFAAWQLIPFISIFIVRCGVLHSPPYSLACFASHLFETCKFILCWKNPFHLKRMAIIISYSNECVVIWMWLQPDLQTDLAKGKKTWIEIFEMTKKVMNENGIG